LTWRGGPVLTSVLVNPIFWGPNWLRSSFAGDKISGLSSFFAGFNGSRYAAVDEEYTGSNGRISANSIRYQGYFLDPTSANGVLAGGDATFFAVRDAVCRNVRFPDRSGNGYYPVFVDVPRPTGSNFCAWHTFDYCRGTRVQFAFHWSLDGDGGCDPRDSSGLHSQGLAALANVAGHELNEARNDPMINAWLDASGYEGADKCAWKFPNGMATLKNGARFKLQAEVRAM
jgi:hypothetical protein